MLLLVCTARVFIAPVLCVCAWVVTTVPLTSLTLLLCYFGSFLYYEPNVFLFIFPQIFSPKFDSESPFCNVPIFLFIDISNNYRKSDGRNRKEILRIQSRAGGVRRKLQFASTTDSRWEIVLNICTGHMGECVGGRCAAFHMHSICHFTNDFWESLFVSCEMLSKSEFEMLQLQIPCMLCCCFHCWWYCCSACCW